MTRPQRDHYDVVVAGGGLAGSAAGRLLARAGLSVLVAERQRYPVHRLCGEFLSVEVQGTFERLGVADAVRQAGAVPVRRARLTAPQGQSLDVPLPGTALGLSRYRLDALLFDAARAAGAEAHDGLPVRGVAGDPERGFTVAFDGGTVAARAVVGAWGKRAGLDGALGRPFVRQRTGWVGAKAHFEGLDLGDLIELHTAPGAYVGLQHVEEGRVNVCWIGEEAGLRQAGSPAAWLAALGAANPALGDRLARLRRVTDFEAVAQVSFARKGLFDAGVVMTGDTAAMIAPLCGDGMAMALHGAELLAPRLAAHLGGRMSRADFEADYTAAWRRAFAPRLRLGRALHAVLTRPVLASASLSAGIHLPLLAAWAVRRTRG
jgi:menaquinone-9 beta-reductase